jgi:hypothetical protein
MIALWLAASLIIRGMAPGQLGCPANTQATSPMQVHARVLKLAREDSSEAMPGTAFSVSFFSMPLDTFSVRIWASNSAGKGCDSVFIRESYIVTGVDASISRASQVLYDVQGRRVRPPLKSGWYCSRNGKWIRVR